MGGQRRRMSERLWLFFLFAWVMAGCAAAPRPPDTSDLPELLIGGLIMENRTTAYIQAARLLVPVTGQFVSCSNIAPGTRCATAFPERRYSGNAFEITWSQSGNIWSTGELWLEPSAEHVEAGDAWVRVIIAGPGAAGAEFTSRP